MNSPASLEIREELSLIPENILKENYDWYHVDRLRIYTGMGQMSIACRKWWNLLELESLENPQHLGAILHYLYVEEFSIQQLFEAHESFIRELDLEAPLALLVNYLRFATFKQKEETKPASELIPRFLDRANFQITEKGYLRLSETFTEAEVQTILEGAKPTSRLEMSYDPNAKPIENVAISLSRKAYEKCEETPSLYSTILNRVRSHVHSVKMRVLGGTDSIESGIIELSYKGDGTSLVVLGCLTEETNSFDPERDETIPLHSSEVVLCTEPPTFERRKLEELKQNQLGWNETTGSARKWWNAFEAENKNRLHLILRLAEELNSRESSIVEFFLTYVESETENIQANLHYLDFRRIKKEEKAKKESKSVAEEN